MHKCIAVLHIMEPFFAQEGYQKSRKRGLEDGNYEVIVCSWLPESGIHRPLFGGTRPVCWRTLLPLVRRS